MSLIDNKELFAKLAPLVVYTNNFIKFGGTNRYCKVIEQANPQWLLYRHNIDSDVEFWWKCELFPNLEHHYHQMSIRDKINNIGKGCNNCRRFIPIDGYLSGELAVKAHWDWHKNKLTPDKVSKYDYNNKYYFRCQFNHSFETRAINFLKGIRCKQFCKQRVVIKGYNSLYDTTTDIETHWDWHKNKLTPDKVAGMSNDVFNFICKICDLGYAKMANEFSKGRRCPDCNSRKAKRGRNTLETVKDAPIWFDHDKNKKKIHEYAKHDSNNKAWFKCPDCDYSFKALPHNFTRGTRCNRCRPAGYSKVSIEWLNCISKKYNLDIQHAKNKKEYDIPETDYFADGYVEFNGKRIVFEFHGDFWHGYKGEQRQDEYNPKNSKLFKQLYDDTIRKEARIKELGYTLIVIWESDYKDQKENFINGNFSYPELE
jgi:predicted Zn-ribbon and HTH transcriptional regulator